VRSRGYLELLRTEHVSRLLFTSLVARLPQGMVSLAILLLLAPRDGYARAGLATGASVITGGISGVLLARQVDRRGARLVLVFASTWYAAALVALAVDADGGFAGQLLICAAIGIATPPITAVARSMWARLLDPSLSQRLFGLEATAQELVYIAGPGLVALIAGTAGPRAAVVATGGLGLLGVIAYVSAPPFGAVRRTVRPPRHRVLRGTGVLGYVATGCCLTVCFAMTEIATVAVVGGRQASAKSGIVLVVWSIGSLLGGLWFGSPAGAVTDRGLAGTISCFAVLLTLSALSPDDVVLAVVLGCSGLALAPSLARLYTRIGVVAPEGSTTEAFGWLSTAFLIGTAAGSTLGGVSVDGLGARPTFALAGAVAVVGAVIAAVKTTRPRVAGGPVTS
jgi:predicted MFS family arabinose efflux permease